MLKDGPKQQVMQGAEAVKMAALSFHKQDVQSFSTDDRQLIPYTGRRLMFAFDVVSAPFWARCLVLNPFKLVG
jgi:hypothetical protein